jgi:hypothetical protein
VNTPYLGIVSLYELGIGHLNNMLPVFNLLIIEEILKKTRGYSWLAGDSRPQRLNLIY